MKIWTRSLGHRIHPLLATSLVAMTLARVAGAANLDQERIPVTDPGLLSSMGFDPHSTTVYATERAMRQMAMNPAQSARGEGNLLAEGEATPAGGPYGTLTIGHTSLGSQAFRPTWSIAAIPAYYAELDGGRYCVAGRPFYDAELEALPHGTRFSRVQLWFYDASGEDATAFIFKVCQAPGPNDPVATLLGQTSTSGASGTQFQEVPIGGPLPVYIDTQRCVYRVRVRLDAGELECSEGDDLRIQKARAAWIREVSPAPAVATFSDVPTTHPFFQHIEALAASGITSGCSPDNFCPNAPLNRGQMAVFLAKALGLHWDVIP